MSLFDGFLNRLVRRGELEVTFPNGRTQVVGSPDPDVGRAAIHIRNRRAIAHILRYPRIGAGESYMNGWIDVPNGDIRRLIRFARQQSPWERGLHDNLGPQSALKKLGTRVGDAVKAANDKVRSRQNVAHHYDIGDDLYELFLDKDWQYSCAYWTGDHDDLDRAQLDKKAHIAAKLNLKPGQRVLDIGCGWGGMALYLNRVADVDVVGVTLSEEQLKRARRRAAEAGVSDRVHFELMDYRDVAGPFDRIVSVGMFEHVGTENFPEFFAKCRELLTDDGVMLLHTIGRMGKPGRTDAFTEKYIFPGGYIPALSEVLEATQPLRFIMSDVELLRVHYAKTIRHWYDRCLTNRDEIIRRYDERFWRMWTFYLAGAETVFEYGQMANFQMQFIMDRNALPLTRDYMAEAEQTLTASG